MLFQEIEISRQHKPLLTTKIYEKYDMFLYAKIPNN